MDVRFVPCPLRGESIQPVAGRCRYCRCDVIAARRATAPPVEPPPALTPPRRWAKRALAVAVIAGAAVLGGLTPGPRKPEVAVAATPPPPPKPSADSPPQKTGMYAVVAGTWRGVGQQYDIHT